MAYQKKRTRKRKEKKGQSIASMMLILLFISAVAFGLGYLTGDKPGDHQKPSVETPEVQKKTDNLAGVPIEEIDPKNVLPPEEKEPSVIDTLEKDRPPVTAPLPVGKPAPLIVPPEKRNVDLKSETELTPGIKLKSPTKAGTKKKQTHKKNIKSLKHKESKKSGDTKKEAGTKALFTVQVASFANKNEARKMSIKLASKGYQSYIRPFTKDGKNWYRVRIGRGITNAEAKKISAKIKSGFPLKPIVTRYF